jgi:hypothetical protein
MVWGFGFVIILHQHRRVYQSQEKFNHLRKVKAEQIARLTLDWQEIDVHHSKLISADHPFAHDLNLVGSHSLFHLLDTSIYPGGGERLLQWLTEYTPKPATIRHRRKLVQELIPRQIFRDRIRVINLFTKLHTSPKDWSIEDIFSWLRLPPKEGIVKPLIIMSLMAVMNIILFGLTLAGWLSPIFIIASFIAYLLVYKLQEKKVTGLFDTAFQIEKILTRFQASLLYLEQFKINEQTALKELLSLFQNSAEKPSVYINRVQKIMSRAALQANQILWGIVNLIIPWDLYHVWVVENLKGEIEEKFSKWVDRFYELEALNSIANFAWLNPDYCWPDMLEGDEHPIEAKDLGHPLIPKKSSVTNNFTIQKKHDLFLITGSNMAGKSTFLRTVGINQILSQTGAPVYASSYKTSFYRLFTSINIVDSLDDGLSHFYAEVKRLRRLLTELETQHALPLMFFVDEIYRGTNNRERFIGSAAFLKAVAGKKGIGMVSSHDLELAELEGEINRLSNWHFTETIKAGKMSFEYKLKPGPCPSTNALYIMKSEGLPVD